MDLRETRRGAVERERAYNVHSLPPLETPFFPNRHLLDRASAYNDLFAFCATLVSGGGCRHSSGLSFDKIEGRTALESLQP